LKNLYCHGLSLEHFGFYDYLEFLNKFFSFNDFLLKFIEIVKFWKDEIFTFKKFSILYFSNLIFKGSFSKILFYIFFCFKFIILKQSNNFQYFVQKR